MCLIGLLSKVPTVSDKDVGRENFGLDKIPRIYKVGRGFGWSFGQRGDWGAAPAKFLNLMLFYLFLHNFFASIFVILNHFLTFLVFSLFLPLFFIIFGSLLFPLRKVVTC